MITILSLIAVSASPFYLDSGPGYVDRSGIAAGDICWQPGSGAANVCIDEGAYAGGDRTTDSTGGNLLVAAENLYPFATQASTAASSLLLRGGLDAKQVYVLDGLAGCTGADTVTATYSVGGAAATTTTCTYGTGWGTGGGLTATIAATQLAACLAAGAGIGATASGAQCPGLGAAADRCVGVTADRLTSTLAISNNDNTCTVDSSGVDGSVIVSDGTENVPSVRFFSEATGYYRKSATALGFVIAGNERLYLTSSGELYPTGGLFSGGDVRVGETSWMSCANRGRLSSPADGFIAVANWAGAQQARLNCGQLASATIDTNSAVAQTIGTVPAGRVWYPHSVSVRDASAAITLATGGFGFDANCTDFLSAQALTALGDASDTIRAYPASLTKSEEGAAAAAFCYKATVQEAAADTVVMDLVGCYQ